MTPDMVQRAKERRETERIERQEWERMEKERLSRVRALVGRSGVFGGGERGGKWESSERKEKSDGVAAVMEGDARKEEYVDEAGFKGVGGDGSMIERGERRRKRMKIVAARAVAGKSGSGGAEDNDGRACEEEEKFADRFRVSGDVAAWMNGTG
jgi:hypothetical protein